MAPLLRVGGVGLGVAFLAGFYPLQLALDAGELFSLHPLQSASSSVCILYSATRARIEHVIHHPELIGEVLERMRGNDPTAGNLASVERRLTQVARQQRNLIETLANVQVAAASLFAEKINVLEEQRTQRDAGPAQHPRRSCGVGSGAGSASRPGGVAPARGREARDDHV